jgi:hypothetical protein
LTHLWNNWRVAMSIIAPKTDILVKNTKAKCHIIIVTVFSVSLHFGYELLFSCLCFHNFWNILIMLWFCFLKSICNFCL